MGKLVILKISEGSPEQGFPVMVQIGEESARATVEITGKLPPNPEIFQHYNCWQGTYRNLGLRSRLQAPPAQVTNVSVTEDCYNVAHSIYQSLNRWLQADSFRPIREKLLEKLLPSDEIRLILQVENTQLQQLPWHLWDWFDRYPKAELALSAPVYERVAPSRSTANRVRVLAVLGSSEGINTQADRELLAQLPDAEVTFLVEPLRKEFSDHLWEKDWDILFFAGHSATQGNGNSGCIYLNAHDSLTMSQLKFALRRSVERGLRLAIFNSCDGLGLARELADLQIPEIIVMREPVPDRVAQEFLKYFLGAFAHGESFYLAVRQARERLQGLEDQFPCATWLPVICQNPAEMPPTWDTLSDRSPQKQTPARSVKGLKLALLSWQLALVTGMAVAGTVLGVRHLGWMQPLELKAFDQVLRLRPAEKPDPRLLIVTIDDIDIRDQRQRKEELRGSSLSDESLTQLLKILTQYQPRVIGVDLYRDFAAAPEHRELATQLSQLPNLVGICKGSDDSTQTPGFEPPPEIPPERIGFSDFVGDQDQVVRRQLLFMTPEPDSPCKANYGFAVQLALHYLAAEKIYPTFTPSKDLQLGNVVFSSLTSRTGGYQGMDAGGSQVLLNYRATRRVGQTIALRDVLAGRLSPGAVQNKIVLVGVTANSSPDFWTTLYTNGLGKTPGVFVQADMVSQMISAVLDDRPLLWTWNPWLESLWVLGWTLVGGLLAWVGRSVLLRLVALGVATLLLYGICSVTILSGGWLPLVPAVFGLLLTGIGTAFYFHLQDRASASTSQE